MVVDGLGGFCRSADAYPLAAHIQIDEKIPEAAAVSLRGLAYEHGVANRHKTDGPQFLNQTGQPQPQTTFPGWARAAMGSTATVSPMTVSELSSGPDQAVFLVSAKAMFMRVQGAWDRNDQGDLYELTTSEMFMRIKKDLEVRRPEPSLTDVTQLDAEILGTERNADEILVSVRFHGEMREDGALTVQPFQEVWHLVKRTGSEQAWQLAGIQQIVS
ncbi:Tim44 domain-containing protein [Burkholderia sp. Ac-20345]|uniref:Tim44 domain-containing protein n=1 Tax=Burkholderia sp. Ac-20345 TaxID=2703891 RepID=UPI00197C4B15|nr:Tim44-like domain-containing protein [Burkholderia sp. Ac-20345]MBN3780419.1 Tim44 domain-containing protein [Burkholderia sp. Ac-20345]